MDAQVVAIGLDGDAAVAIGAVGACPRRAQPLERLCRGVAVRVAGAGADDGHARPQGVEEGLRRGAAAAMVGHLDDVEAPPVGDAAGDELRVDLLLDVPGEQEAPRPEADVEDERHVVDARARIWRFSGHAVARRPTRPPGPPGGGCPPAASRVLSRPRDASTAR